MNMEKAISNDHEFIAQVIRALPKHMGHDVKQGWIENPRALAKALSEALCPPLECDYGFPFLGTIRLGSHLSVDELYRSIVGQKDKIDTIANDMLTRTSLSPITDCDVILLNASVFELTGKKRATNREVKESIRAKGYEICPAEVGPQLRRQYRNQPKGEWLNIAMDPMFDKDGSLFIYSVACCAGEYWLRSSGGGDEHYWNGEDRFVFIPRVCK